MAKYFANVGGRVTEIPTISTSVGAPDADKIVALNSAGQFDITLMPTGIGPDVATMPASESLSAGDYVNVWNDSGTVKARKADATTAGKEANGFVLAAFTSGQSAAVYLDGSNTGVTGLTPGARYYLSASAPGQATATAPSGSGNVVQFLGIAVSASSLSFHPDDGFVLA